MKTLNSNSDRSSNYLSIWSQSQALRKTKGHNKGANHKQHVGRTAMVRADGREETAQT